MPIIQVGVDAISRTVAQISSVSASDITYPDNAIASEETYDSDIALLLPR